MGSQAAWPSLGGESGVGPGPRGSALWHTALLLPIPCNPFSHLLPGSLFLFLIVLDVCLFWFCLM